MNTSVTALGFKDKLGFSQHTNEVGIAYPDPNEKNIEHRDK